MTELKKYFQNKINEESDKELLDLVYGYIENRRDKNDMRSLSKLPKGYLMKLSDIMTEYRKDKKLKKENIEYLKELKNILF